MRRSWVGALGAALALTVAPAAADAQQRTCRQVLPADARRLINAQGQEIYYFLDPVRVLCTGGVRLEADSAVMNRNEATVVLVGDVVYRDSARQMTADWANYLARRDQLLARDNVVLRDLESGSRVTGRFLDYLRETESRPVATMIVREGRPHAVIPPRTEGAVEDSGAVATEVWADRMEFRGEESFSAEGDVELMRGGTRGRGDRATFDQRAELITLIGSAHVEDDRYRLEGERIDAFLRDDEVREVLSREDARVESAELDVRSERIRIAFDEGRLQRMEAWNPEPETTPRARAFAEEFHLRADSIDARADSSGIREVRAVGRAYGERGADSIAVALPGAVSRDWIQGDTIIGYFTRAPEPDSVPATPEADRLAVEPSEPAGEPAAPVAPVAPARPPGDEAAGPVDIVGDSAEVVLEKIVVIGGGGPALSLYRMAAEQAGAPPSVNFMKAGRIILFMERGDVARVEAEGPIEGLYLDSSGREPGGSGPTEPAGEGGP